MLPNSIGQKTWWKGIRRLGALRGHRLPRRKVFRCRFSAPAEPRP